MAVRIPTLPTFTNSKTPYLTPQILVDVALEDITKSGFGTIEGQAQIDRYNRIATVEIQLLYIKQSSLSSALTKMLDILQKSIINDLNPEARGTRAPLALDTEKASVPQLQFAVQVDNTREIKTVNVWGLATNLKIEFVAQTFTRLKQYVLDSVTDVYE